MLPEDDSVRIEIFALNGAKVEELYNDFMNAGNHIITWDPKDLPSGVYSYTITTTDTTMNWKISLLK